MMGHYSQRRNSWRMRAEEPSIHVCRGLGRPYCPLCTTYKTDKIGVLARSVACRCARIGQRTKSQALWLDCHFPLDLVKIGRECKFKRIFACPCSVPRLSLSPPFYYSKFDVSVDEESDTYVCVVETNSSHISATSIIGVTLILPSLLFEGCYVNGALKLTNYPV